jgi:hypothetical protein
MPNRERCAEVADLIAAHHDQFSMSVWAEDLNDPECPEVNMVKCDTVACIAGWTLVAATNSYLIDATNAREDAAEYLGLTKDQSGALFTADYDWWWRRKGGKGGFHLLHVEAKDAIEVLRDIADGVDVFANLYEPMEVHDYA